MIAGTLVMEDVTVHFRMPTHQDGQVTVHVTEGLHGETAQVLCSPRAFAASLALAFDFDGMDGADVQAGLYELAETIEFPSYALRWIP